MVGAAFWRTPVYVLLGATLILLLVSGVRQSFGLFIQPISVDMSWGRGSMCGGGGSRGPRSLSGPGCRRCRARQGGRFRVAGVLP